MSVLTLSQTVDIGYGRGRLAPDAAASVRRIDAELGRPLDVNSAWRDPELQDRMYRAWVAYIDGRGPKPNHGRALPSWSSVHCKGRAIDTDDTALGRVLNAHGWFRTASDEPWHYEYFSGRDNHRNKPAGTGTTDIPEEVFNMAEMVIVTEKNNQNQLLSDKDRRAAFVNTESGFECSFSWLTLADADRWAKQVGMPAGAVRLSDAGFDKFLGRLATVRG